MAGNLKSVLVDLAWAMFYFVLAGLVYRHLYREIGRKYTRKEDE